LIDNGCVCLYDLIYLEFGDLQNKEDGATADMIVIERPHSWGHLIKTLYNLDE
jgi:hypothetical protein